MASPSPAPAAAAASPAAVGEAAPATQEDAPQPQPAQQQPPTSPCTTTRTRSTPALAPARREPPKGMGILPCIEQPSRCIINSISHPHRRLTSGKRGKVELTRNRGEKEQFFLLPVVDTTVTTVTTVDPPTAAEADKGAATAAASEEEGTGGKEENDEKMSASDDSNDEQSQQQETTSTSSQNRQAKSVSMSDGGDGGGGGPMFHLKSYKFPTRYLTSSADGTVTTTQFATKDNPQAAPDESAKWILMRSPHDAEKGCHFLVSAMNEKNLAVIGEGEGGAGTGTHAAVGGAGAASSRSSRSIVGSAASLAAEISNNEDMSTTTTTESSSSTTTTATATATATAAAAAPAAESKASSSSSSSSAWKQRPSLSSLRSSAQLVSSSTTRLTPTIGLNDQNDECESWKIELITGELCFITAPPPSGSATTSSTAVAGAGAGPTTTGDSTNANNTERHLRCDMLGRLTLTSTAKGWEVWRFVESGGGKLKICSWMHSQHYLCCNPNGNDGGGHGEAITCSAARIQEQDGEKEETNCDYGGSKSNSGGGMEEWYVEKAPGQDTNGVVIRSASSKHLGDFLCHNLVGAIYTSVSFEGEASVWHLNAGHSQRYTLASLYNSPKTMGPFPYVTDSKKQVDEIVVEQLDEEGTVRLYHLKQDKYLGSDENGDVWLAKDALESELWKMDDTRSDGGYTFVSVKHEGRILSYRCDGEGGSTEANSKLNPKLCTVTETGEDQREVWRVDPILPRAVSSGKIKTFAIGTGIAVGTTVAMPFAMAGLAAVIGTESILMGVVTAGLTTAEAIASVGAVGATAAICFRESGDTLGMESEHDVQEEEKEKPYMKRPLCAWKVW